MKLKQRSKNQGIPYSNLVDNIKVLLIFLVVFNHLIAFQLVKVDVIVRYVWYAITIFHMPAFVFMSGYLSKKPQDITKNVKNLLVPYILGYSLTWYAQIWLGKSVDFEILRPSGTVMWYVLALFVYRLTIEALGKIRFIVPLSIIFALWAGTRAEFTTYLSTSRIVVFFPFFVAGYLWKNDYIKAVRRFKGKWVLLLVSGFMLYAIPNYMISSEMPIDIFRGNHSYLVCGLTDEVGIIIRLLMYLVSFTLILTFLAIMPDIRLPLTFIGRNTMGIYFFHYPIMIIMNGLLILSIPKHLNVWVLLLMSLVFVLVLGSPPVDWLYNAVLNLIYFLLIKREKKVEDEGLEDEYDGDNKELELIRRKRAIEELAASLEPEDDSKVTVPSEKETIREIEPEPKPEPKPAPRPEPEVRPEPEAKMEAESGPEHRHSFFPETKIDLLKGGFPLPKIDLHKSSFQEPKLELKHSIFPDLDMEEEDSLPDITEEFLVEHKESLFTGEEQNKVPDYKGLEWDEKRSIFLTEDQDEIKN